MTVGLPATRMVVARVATPRSEGRVVPPEVVTLAGTRAVEPRLTVAATWAAAAWAATWAAASLAEYWVGVEPIWGGRMEAACSAAAAAAAAAPAGRQPAPQEDGMAVAATATEARVVVAMAVAAAQR